MPELDARVSQVTVYPDRALVTRTGSIELDAGEHVLRVADLPSLVPESLRAALRGPSGTRVVSVDVGTAFHARAPEPEIAELEGRLERLRADRARLGARAEALADRRAWMRGVGERAGEFARGLAQGTMTAEGCEGAFRFLAERALGDAEEGLELESQARRLDADVDAAERELARRRGGDAPDRPEARITVALASAGRCEVDVSYLVRDASWQPAYDVRVEPDAERVQVSSLGVVRQGTGERWAGVSLALSTARPGAGASPPELGPWYLRVPEPSPSRPLAARRHLAAPGGAARGPEELEEAEEDVAEVDLSGPSAVFRIARPVEVDADSSPHRVTIESREMPCELDRVTAPARDESAHLHASVTNDSGHVLLAGDASIFHGGDFAGTVRIRQTAPGAGFDAYLGLDDEIEVKRELVERAVDRGSILQSGVRRTTYGYRIRVRNRAAAARRVEVRDRLPVSRNEQVRVRVHDVSPAPSDRDELEALTWRFTLDAGGELAIRTRFSVEQPSTLRVAGLPE